MQSVKKDQGMWGVAAWRIPGERGSLKQQGVVGGLGVVGAAAQGGTQRVPGGKWTWGPDPEPTLTDAVTTLTLPTEAFGALGGRRVWAMQNVREDQGVWGVAAWRVARERGSVPRRLGDQGMKSLGVARKGGAWS